jgi:hypothetical protein
MKPIAENHLEASESEKSSEPITKRKPSSSNDQGDEEGLERSGEDIDLLSVDILSKATSNREYKPILSQEEIKAIELQSS